MSLGAAEDLKIEIAASTVNNVVVASLGAAITVSVATTIGATVVASSSAAVATSAAAGAAGAATGGASGGAAGAAGSGSGGGGGAGGGAGGIADVATVLMAVQRLCVLASMPVDMSEMHVRVGETVVWAKGSLGLFQMIVSEEARQYWGWGDQPKNAGGGRTVGTRRGTEASPEPGDNVTTYDAAEVVEENEQLLWHNALKGLVDTLTTLACALAAVTSSTTIVRTQSIGLSSTQPTRPLPLILPTSSSPPYFSPYPLQVLLLQLIAHLLWKHCVNRRYYVRRNQMQIQKASTT